MAKKQTSRIGASFMALALAVTSTFCMGTFAVSAANTDAQPSESGSATAVLNNEAGWTTCNVYYWGNGGNVSNKSWPGVTLTDADKNADGFYEVEIDAQYLTETNGVIFNNGSEQSADLDIAAGECKVYNNKTKTWEDYDTSALKLSLSTDVASPQYNGTEIVLTATASGGSGSYTYTFKAGSTTIYTGSNNTCTWTPTTAGTYTVSVSVADTEGNTNEKSTSYVIKDDTNAAEPVLKGISTGYTDNKVPVNTSIPINVNASGGKTGTNLLFYKVAVTDPSGNAVNTVYYKQSNILNFTPTTTGSYTVDVTVQASDNKTVNKKYTVEVQTSSTTTPVISSFTASPTSTTVGTATTLKTVVKSGTGTANFTYTYYANSTVIATKTSSSRTSTYSWTPTTAGTYTLKVVVTDANSKTVSKSISNFTVEDSTATAPVISSFTASPTSTTVGIATTLKTVVKSGTGTANFTYTYYANSTVIATKTSSSRTSTYSWKPKNAGTYTLKVVVTDANGNTVSKSISNFVVSSGDDDYTLGDVNCDGKVSAADAIYVSKSVAGMSDYALESGTTAFKAADMDGNGKVTIADAVAITRAYL